MERDCDEWAASFEEQELPEPQSATKLPWAILLEAIDGTGRRALQAVESAAEAFVWRINEAVRNPEAFHSHRITDFVASAEYFPDEFRSEDDFSPLLYRAFYDYGRRSFAVASSHTGPLAPAMFDGCILTIPQARFRRGPDSDTDWLRWMRCMPELPEGVVWPDPRVLYRVGQE